MSRLTLRQKQALATKKRILETALNLFSKKGFDNVTVDEIAQESETSKGAFYNHFESKDAIFIEKFKEIDSFYTSFLKSISKHNSESEKIIKLVEGQMIFIMENLGKDIMRTIYMNAISNKPNQTLANRERPLYQIIESLIEQGQINGEFNPEASITEASMLITRSMRGAIYDWCLFNEDFDLHKEGRKLVYLVVNDLKK